MLLKHTFNCACHFFLFFQYTLNEAIPGINISAVITALQAPQNHSNSRRLESGEREEKRRQKFHIILASAFLQKGPQAGTCLSGLVSVLALAHALLLFSFVPITRQVSENHHLCSNPAAVYGMRDRFQWSGISGLR